MYDNENYPVGADNPYAPWNKKPIPSRFFPCTIETTLIKTDYVCTDGYDTDEFGEISTDNVAWRDEYERHHNTIQDLLHELEQYVKADLERYKGNKREEMRLRNILQDIDSWEIEDITITPR